MSCQWRFRNYPNGERVIMWSPIKDILKHLHLFLISNTSLEERNVLTPFVNYQKYRTLPHVNKLHNRTWVAQTNGWCGHRMAHIPHRSKPLPKPSWIKNSNELYSSCSAPTSACKVCRWYTCSYQLSIKGELSSSCSQALLLRWVYTGGRRCQ